MITMRGPRFRRMYLLAAAIPLLGTSLLPTPSERGSVIVAIPREFPDAAFQQTPQEHLLAAIVREPGKTDVIVLNRETASPRVLGAAIVRLRKNRASIPETERGLVLLLKTTRLGTNKHSTATVAKALAIVQAQPVAQLGNMGPGRWYEFTPEMLGF